MSSCFMSFISSFLASSFFVSSFLASSFFAAAFLPAVFFAFAGAAALSSFFISSFFASWAKAKDVARIHMAMMLDASFFIFISPEFFLKWYSEKGKQNSSLKRIQRASQKVLEGHN